MQPRYQITADGVDVTDAIRKRFIKLVWRDERGYETDTLTLTLDDRPELDGSYIEMPRTGVKLTLSLGYGEQLEQVGDFVVSECNPSGFPERLTIKAHAADMKAGLKEKRSRGFDHISIHDLMTTIATEHGYKAKVSPALASQSIPRIDQSNENDMHLLQRLAKERGAVAKISNGYLLFVLKGDAKSVSGQVLPTVDLHKTDLSSFYAVFADREQYQQVTARYHSKATGMEHYTHVGSGFPVFAISRIFTDAASAQAAAQARYDQQAAGKLSLDFTTAGNTSMLAEAAVNITGMRPGIPSAWVCDSAEHSLDKAKGWQVRLKLVQKKPA